MQKTRFSVASLPSLLTDKARNEDRVGKACVLAEEAESRLLLLPELMLTGHGDHPLMILNAESVPDGKLAASMLALSERHNLCTCVGMAEKHDGKAYNSHLVVDKGR